MRFNPFLLPVSVMAFLTLGSAPILAADPSPAASPFDGVTVETINGWSNSFSLHASHAEVRAEVVPAVGGRILHYSLNRQNILLELTNNAGLTLETSPSFPIAGYQCDVGPELGYPPAHAKLWQGVWKGDPFLDYSVRMSSEPDATLGVRLEKEVVMDGDSGDLGIIQRMVNTSDKEIAYCLWDRTLCRGGGFAFFPLNKKSRFAAKWSARGTFEGKYFYDGDKPASTHVKILDGVLVARCEGEATKIGADSDAGWVAYVKGRLLLVKYFPYSPKGNYTDGGNSVEVYFDTTKEGVDRAEIEPLSPEARLKPFEAYVFPEKWTLIELDEEVFTAEQARALVKRIPKTPFKNK
jgi:hypothetical protein